MEIFLKEAKDAKERKDSKIKWWENIPPIGDGSICFMNLEYFREVKERYNTKRKSLEKAGWLTKQGHQFKTWKRRWFILKNTKLSYYKKPQVHSF